MAKCDISRSEKNYSARATVEDILAYEANRPVVVGFGIVCPELVLKG